MDRLLMDDEFSLMSKDLRILGIDYLWMMSLMLLEEWKEQVLSSSSTNMKPLFSTRIKQSS